VGLYKLACRTRPTQKAEITKWRQLDQFCGSIQILLRESVFRLLILFYCDLLRISVQEFSVNSSTDSNYGYFPFVGACPKSISSYLPSTLLLPRPYLPISRYLQCFVIRKQACFRNSAKFIRFCPLSSLSDAGVS